MEVEKYTLLFFFFFFFSLLEPLTPDTRPV
jgi:hypothetical protein